MVWYLCCCNIWQRALVSSCLTTNATGMPVCEAWPHQGWSLAATTLAWMTSRYVRKRQWHFTW